jgi:hypothetical protein
MELLNQKLIYHNNYVGITGMKKITIATPSDQQTLTVLFSKNKAEKVKAVEKVISTGLTHEDPQVQAFYKTLTPAQVTAHMIATTHLGTSYDVTRTHGFIAWKKTLTK